MVSRLGAWLRQVTRMRGRKLLRQHLLIVEPVQLQQRVEVMPPPPGDGSTTETRLEVIQTLPVIQTPQLELVVRQVALLCWRELLNF